MKRNFGVVSLLVFMFLLSACGGEGYRYSFIPSEHYCNSMVVDRNLELTNGALLDIPTTDLYTEKYSENYLNVGIGCLFDEESKTIIPLCFDAVCKHDTEECFARSFYTLGYNKCYGIYNDEVFVLTDYFQGNSVDISVYFMSFDGTVQRKVVLDKSMLKERGSGEDIYPTLLYPRMVTYGNMLYFAVIDNIGAHKYYEPGSTETITHWIMSFDMVEESFDMVARLEMPNTVNQTQHVYIADGKIMMDVDGIAYVVDILTGEQTVIDHAATVSKLIEEGQIPKGGQLSSYYLIHKDLILVEHMSKKFIRTKYYVDPETSVLVELSEFEMATAEIYRRENFGFENVFYVYGGLNDDSFIYFNDETGDKLSVGRYLGEDKILSGVYATSENGIILTYYPLNEDGTVDNGVETVMENGVEVNYYTSNKYLYVTKEDFLDGKIDSPLFFDIETGTFS